MICVAARKSPERMSCMASPMTEARSCIGFPLVNSVGERRLDGGTCLQRAEHMNGFDRLPREGRGYVVGDAHEPECLDAELGLGSAHGFEIRAGKLLQS